jgi:hypothetical protein
MPRRFWVSQKRCGEKQDTSFWIQASGQARVGVRELISRFFMPACFAEKNEAAFSALPCSFLRSDLDRKHPIPRD